MKWVELLLSLTAAQKVEAGECVVLGKEPSEELLRAIYDVLGKEATFDIDGHAKAEGLLNRYTEYAEKLNGKAAEKTDPSYFHLYNDKGKVTGVFDLRVFQHIKETHDLFILGGVPYLYHAGVFRPDPAGSELKTMIRKLIFDQFVKAPTIKRIYELFLYDAELQVTTEDLNDYPETWINFTNGFYDPVTKKLISHDPKYKAVNQIPHAYDPERELKGSMVTEWLQFICPDPEDKEMLLQFAGLCMTRDARQQKFLILNGQGATGKSTVIRMIDKVIGSDNISNISLGQLGQRFAAYGLLGKLLNSCADLEIDALTDVSTLKKVLGEDTLSAEAKGKDAISFKSYAKLIFSTNELPIIKSEKTNGFYRRLLVLTMNKVPEKQETDFFNRLSAEIDSFIRLSVAALERMYQSGRIMESARSIEAVNRLRRDSDTSEAFLSEKVVRSQSGRVKRADLYREYESFCQEQERQPLTRTNFFRSLRAKAVAEVKVAGEMYFKGIVLKEEHGGWKTVKADPFSRRERDEEDLLCNVSEVWG